MMPFATLSPHSRLGFWRVGIGAAQALLLLAFFLWVDGKGGFSLSLRAGLYASILFVPPVVYASIGVVRWRFLLPFALATGLLAFWLGRHSIARNGLTPFALGFTEFFFLLSFAVALLLGHTFLVAGSREGRLVARYPVLFATAWRHVLQFFGAMLIVLAVWLLILLAAYLFKSIQIDGLTTLIEKSAFVYPVVALSYAAAFHLSDARATAFADATLSFLLAAFRWLLPVSTLIVAAFLVTLAFTGLEPLWRTKWSAVTMMLAAAALIVLMNAVHRADGLGTARVLSVSSILAILCLPVLVGLAAISFHLRVGQHGWSPPRIEGAVYLAILAVGAAGYLLALLRGRRWMTGIGPVNLVLAAIIAIALLVLRSPVADPYRLTVADQLRRLQTGAVSPEAFDYRLFHARLGRYGEEALFALSSHQNPVIARAATAAPEPWRRPSVPFAERVTVYPAGTLLPEDFMTQVAAHPTLTGFSCASTCQARLIDIDRDGDREILIQGIDKSLRLYKKNATGWVQLSLGGVPVCDAGDFARNGAVLEPAAQDDIVVGGRRFRVALPNPPCPSQ